MAKSNECWGIEVGTSALKAIRLVKSAGGVEVADYEVLPHQRVLTTPDLDQDEAVRLALDALTSKHDLSKSSVVVSVPGHRAFARFAKLPPVEPKKIPDIVRFEAVQQIPFPIEQVEWDYQVFQQEDMPDVEVGIFAITKDRVNEFLRNYRSQGIDVDEITLSPVGVFNAFAHEGIVDDGEGLIVMDIGGVSTDLIIIEGGGIWLRTLPIGGANFTEALVKAFKLSYSKAEKLKREAATSKYARQIFQAMRPVFSDLVQEVQKSLGYYQSLNRDSNLTRVVGLGSTFRLPGLQKFLKQQLQMDVTRPNKFKNVTVEGKREADFSDHAMNLATAYGLALQGLGVGRVRCNLLPSYLMRGRMWKAKQPWFAAAAACLALAAGLAFFSLWSEKNRWSAEAEQIDQRFEQVTRTANGFANQWRDLTRRSDPRLQIENVRGILDYRGLWSGVYRDLSLALETVQADPAVYEASYDRITGLPPDLRRRVYVERVNVNYLGTGPARAPQIATLSDPATYWPNTEAGGNNAAGSSGGRAAAGTLVAPNSPRFEVVVEGFLDANEATAARILDTGPGRWLRDNRVRPDRPYVLVIPGDSVIRELAAGAPPIVAEESGPNAGAANPGARRAAARPARREFASRPRFNDDLDNDFDGLSPGRRSGGAAAALPTVTAASTWDQLVPLLPKNPMAEFVSPRVMKFVLRWEVVLRRPEDGRRSTIDTPDVAPPASDAAPSTGSTPAGPDARVAPAIDPKEADA